MQISHVIRGDDHLNNTPRQINILRALGARIPEYAHIPMINGPDGKKLSKRHGAVSVMQYHEEGYLTEAMINYLVRLGWSHGDQEIFTLNEMIEKFDIKDINKSSSSLNIEKLQWLNQQYMIKLDPIYVAEQLAFYMLEHGINIENGPKLTDVVEQLRERCKTLVEMVENSRFFYEDFSQYDAKAAKKQFKADTAAVLAELKQQFVVLEDWRASAIHGVVEATVEKLGVGFGKVGQPLRLAVTGTGNSPSIDTTLELLGKQKTLARLDQAMDFIDKGQAGE
jgi:glutamyl-tRNA synthetase